MPFTTDIEDRARVCQEMANSGCRDSAQYAIAEALFAVASAIRSAASELGTGNAATPMGAIEVLSVSVKDGLSSVADALQAIAVTNENLSGE